MTIIYLVVCMGTPKADLNAIIAKYSEASPKTRIVFTEKVCK